jgi:hypothetical protein
LQEEPGRPATRDPSPTGSLSDSRSSRQLEGHPSSAGGAHVETPEQARAKRLAAIEKRMQDMSRGTSGRPSSVVE